MYIEKAKQLEKELIEFTDICKDGGGHLYFFGAGKLCNLLIDWFQGKNLSLPSGIFDNSKEKHGTLLKEIPIISFQEMSNLSNAYIIIIMGMCAEEVEQQVLEKLDNTRIFNIQEFFREITDFEILPLEKKQEIRRYTASLRNETGEKFPLKKPEDMPQEAKELVRQLEEMKEAYRRGENKLIDKGHPLLHCKNWDFFYLENGTDKYLVDFLNSNTYSNCIKIGDKKEHSVLDLYELLEPQIDFDVVAENITEFSRYLKEKEVPFLYMQAPSKVAPDGRDLPSHIEDPLNPAIDGLIRELKKSEVNVIDYRQVLMEKSEPYLDHFYKGDLHWETRAAFEATGYLCEKLSQISDLQFDFEKLKLENYHQILYPNIFLGSSGTFSGILFSGLDDFELIIPKYETDFVWKSPLRGQTKRGSAEEALFFPPNLNWEYFQSHPYCCNSIGYRTDTIIQNLKAKNNYRILCLHDSFAMPMGVFLAPQFSELYFMDLRGKSNKKDVFKLIDKVKPHVVVMINTTVTLNRSPELSDINPYTD